MDFNQWYRSKIESSQDDPPERVWDSIQDELDTDLVWARIEQDLPATGSRKMIYLWSMAASLALLIGLAAWMFVLRDWGGMGQSPLVWRTPWPVGLELQPKSLQQAAETLEDTELPAHHQTLADYPASALPARMPSAKLEPSPTETVSGTLASLALLRAPAMTIQALETSQGMQTAGIKPAQQSELLPMASLDETPVSFSVGVIGQYANTWLLNQKTIRGMQRQELTATNASFGNNFGLVANAGITSRTGVRAELHLVSQTRQYYHEYISGRYSATGLELDYVSLSLMLTQRLGSKQSPHWIMAGLYTSALQQAREKTNERVAMVNNEYTSMDAGILAGYEYQLLLPGQLHLGLGGFAKLGLRNAFAGNQQIPEHLNRTRNASFILSLSLNYNIN
jgi:hypothetical protein